MLLLEKNMFLGRTDNLDRHMEKHKTSNASHCEVCGKAFSRPYNLYG